MGKLGPIEIEPDDIRALDAAIAQAAAKVENLKARRRLMRVGQPQQIVAQILKERQDRARAFIGDNDLFGEPAWDMLLAIYLGEARGVRLCIKSVCLWAGCPGTTGLRYLSLLEQRGFVVSERDPSDRRLRVLRATDRLMSLMNSYAGRVSSLAADNAV